MLNTAIVWINHGFVKNKGKLDPLAQAAPVGRGFQQPGTPLSISSMTGYAVATSEGAAGTLTIEIKSVNCWKRNQTSKEDIALNDRLR